ncbi:MAG TPA: squalene/phytoene synthase family protein [Prolixibacteraceae bacterium]|nr:squalene/phytoene synthase family protein [Prolixibacteraceae bacterium]
MTTALHPTLSLYQDIFHSIDFKKIIDHPNILIAARFWEPERYQAAKNCYKFMRAIDDLIDHHKTEHGSIAQQDKADFETQVVTWISSVADASQDEMTQAELMETVHKFCLPLWPLEAFAKSMIYDIYHDGFPTLQSFIEYAGGASVAPASIFVHLCGLTKKDGKYKPPMFDVKRVSTPCAIFSYLVHIIRDFQKDHLNNLNYFGDDLMEKNGLNRQRLLHMAQGAPITDGFRELIRELYEVAELYRRETYDMIQEVRPFLEPRCQLSLEIIFTLYQMVFERIDVKKGSFTTQELNPTPQEIKERVWKTIMEFKAH